MSDQRPAPARPEAVKTINGTPMPGGKPGTVRPTGPRAIVGNVQARARPSALPIPADRRVSAFVPTPVFDRWSEESAGIRPAALEQGDNVITIADL